MPEPEASLAPLVGHLVILDTRSHWLYIGRLERVSEHFLELSSADAHDSTEGHSTKEIYILEAKKFGVKKNRERVLVRFSEVIGISKLADVTEY